MPRAFPLRPLPSFSPFRSVILSLLCVVYSYFVFRRVCVRSPSVDVIRNILAFFCKCALVLSFQLKTISLRRFFPVYFTLLYHFVFTYLIDSRCLRCLACDFGISSLSVAGVFFGPFTQHSSYSHYPIILMTILCATLSLPC